MGELISILAAAINIGWKVFSEVLFQTDYNRNSALISPASAPLCSHLGSL